MIRGHLVTMLAATASMAGSSAFGQVALFDQRTDTIRLPGQQAVGTEATFEARVLLFDQPVGGYIWNEHQGFAEDKQLYASISYIQAYAYPIGFPNALGTSVPVSPNQWHHIAYVKDVSEERLYLDGQLILSRATSGDIGDDNGAGRAAVGANWRTDGPIIDSFLGMIDTLRISDIARYDADFTPPQGDLNSDGNTRTLLNFNEPRGSTIVVDHSGHGEDGIIGPWFDGSTEPQLCPDPYIHAQPQSVNAAPNDAVLFAVAAVGVGPFSYAWHYEGTPIDTALNPSASTPTLELAAVNCSDAGVYDCVITDACGQSVSDPAVLSVEPCCPADLNDDGAVNFFDVQDFLNAYAASHPDADWNNDGAFNFFDVQGFLNDYAAGCN